MKIDREEAIMEVGGKLLHSLGLIQGLFLLLIIASPFVYMWSDWATCWRVIVTGVGGVLLVAAIYKIIHNYIGEKVDEMIKKFESEPKRESAKSKWMSRVEDAMKEAELRKKL